MERGFGNLARHIENVSKFRVPVLVAMNRFVTDSDEELAVDEECRGSASALAL